MARRMRALTASPLTALGLLVLMAAVCSAFRAQQPAPTPRSDGIRDATASTSAFAAPPPPTPTPDWVSLPPFPNQFTADYHRVELYFSAINATGTIYQDAINQRCRMSSKATGDLAEYYDIEQLAIFRPPGAQPNTAPANLLTIFNYGPYGVEGTAYPSIYSARTAETEFQSIYPFPAYWFGYTGTKPMIYPFWMVPYYMFANGTTTIDGVKGLRYISTNMCNMTIVGLVPCITYVIAADTGLPLQTINATPRRPNSFESDHYEVMTYSNFKVGPPDESAFALPSNWTVAYRNYNNDVAIERMPGTSSSIVSPSKPLNLTLHLTTVPVQPLGPVTLKLVNAPGLSYNCTSCISWSPTSFTFTPENWHTPQTLTVTYLNDGVQRLNLTASGGSYDWLRPYSDFSYYLTFYACKNGVTGIQCNT